MANQPERTHGSNILGALKDLFSKSDDFPTESKASDDVPDPLGGEEGITGYDEFDFTDD